MSRFAAFALGVVLIASSDWALVAPTQPDLPAICAKSEAVCEAAVRAIRNGVLGWEQVYTTCVPAPGCFSPESECIDGYNCHAPERRR